MRPWEPARPAPPPYEARGPGPRPQLSPGAAQGDISVQGQDTPHMKPQAGSAPSLCSHPPMYQEADGVSPPWPGPHLQPRPSLHGQTTVLSESIRGLQARGHTFPCTRPQPG